MVKFEVGVEEGISGSRQNASASILLHKYSYKIELIKSSDFYQPGLPFNPMIRVTQFDGSPLGKLKQPVKVKAGFSGDGKDLTENFHPLDQDGMVKLKFDPLLTFDSSSTLEIEAEYPDANKLQAVIYPSQSQSKSYMQVILNTENPKVNEEVQIEVLSTVPLPHITYLVFGRGEILYSRTVVPSNPSQSSIQIKFFATRAMAPAARFIAYFVPPGSKEIIANGLVIKFSKTFQNFVKINTSPVIESRPGSEITFTLSAKAYSHMAVMAVDQRTLSLGKDYNISPEKILEDMDSYFGIQESILASGLTFDKSVYYRSPSVHFQDVFSRFDAVILTNGEVNSNQITENPPKELFSVAAIGSGEIHNPQFGVTRPPLAGPFAFSRIPAPSWDYRPRVHLIQDLSDTWIFTNISSGPDGKVTLKRTLPENMTSWLVSAFSVDPVHGIGLLSQEVKIIGKKSFYMNVDFPSPVFLGEIVSISIAVSNFMSQEHSVDVMLENGENAFHFVENGSKEFRRDLLGNTISNLGKLIRLPMGCGEQNMATLVPNIAILEYLKNTKQLTKAIENKAIEHIEIGYQQQLSYLLSDGSFSAFGPQDAKGNVPQKKRVVLVKPSSTVITVFMIIPKVIGLIDVKVKATSSLLREAKSRKLTAFVAKYINQAFMLLGNKRGGQPLLLKGSQKVVEEAFAWLKSVQASNGSFPEVGTIMYEDMQGSRSSALPLTAYTLLSFIDNQKYQQKPIHQNAINKALDYIARNLEELEEPYAMSLCAYALHMAKHPAKETAFHLLESMSKTN
ncbi:hypothetical protein J437_LFUL012760, partial [Ladona fulva]